MAAIDAQLVPLDSVLSDSSNPSDQNYQPPMANISQSTFQEITATTLQSMLETQSIQLIDVRERSEFAGEHIAGAKLMPLSQFQPSQVTRDPKQPIVLYCQSGMRTSRAAQQLIAAGIQPVLALKGGLSSWKAAGLPTVTNPKAPISLQRQVQITAGSLVLIGTVLGAFVSPAFLLLSGFVGAGLIFAGVSNTCMMANLLAKLPYNQ